MAYSLDQKITGYLRAKGIDNARVLESIIVLPLPENGEFHRKIRGVITSDKLDAIIADYQAATNG
jgi:hypothetical protein